ncbi:acyl-CoA-like ligand-binding transcription factor [Klenkia taihuensis]|uniref:Transcriptional regulator, TetR family n=1 Tax=Klenkia taihuensis TaxID=1225127 RepID=A0A1I1V1E1_9ACTN|nr:TetR family transcriptional regulator [Klenkia taihuensis]GHE14603.1 putative transcriptional regulatory protein TetR [Klenkia taihuensis]SFD76699.1 transcriptional regulator, TetR family [Klenkia taihuensis]
MTTGERGGRPAVTSAQELSEVALRLFVERGYDETSVDDVAAAAGIGRRTFFRYFPTKADALFAASPGDVRRLADSLAAADADEPVRAAVRRAVLTALAVPPGEEGWVRRRALLVLTVPALRAHGHTTFDAWRAAVAGFTARRLGLPLDDVVPVAVGHAALAASLTAHEHWLSTAGGTLAESLAAALDLLLPDV